MEFKDKVVMITGSTGGIGKACAVLYAKDEALLALLGRSAEKLEALRSELGLAKDRCVLFAGDISSEAYVRGAVQETLDRFGRIDVLINTAGNGPARSDQVWIMETNDNEPLMRCRKNKDVIKTGNYFHPRISSGGACL